MDITELPLITKADKPYKMTKAQAKRIEWRKKKHVLLLVTSNRKNTLVYWTGDEWDNEKEPVKKCVCPQTGAQAMIRPFLFRPVPSAFKKPIFEFDGRKITAIVDRNKLKVHK